MTSNGCLKGTFKEETGSVCMDASSKLDMMGSRDAISCLPQEVLGDILSLLPTKLAASTSVLAKKWRYLFALVNNLDLDDSDSSKEESFRNFVDRTLELQRGYPIKKFSLKYHVTNNSDVVNERRWISSVVERGVLEVDVRLRPRWVDHVDIDEVHGNCLLPYHLFRSKTLVKLSLGTNTDIGTLPSDASLPSLKSLFIDTIVFDDQDLCDVLLPGCPVLDELTVVHQTDFYPYRISSQTIKKLRIYYDCDFGIDYGAVMSFDAPSLVSLDYTDFALAEYPLANLGSLVEAKLNLSYSKKKIKRPDVTGLLVGISNVETLHLSPNSADVISRCVKHGLVLPVFNNLVTLSFGSNNKRGWKLLPYLLKQSPKLETLIIQGLDGYTGDVTIGLFQVKELHVVGYRGTALELLHLKSLLAGAECIPKVRVEFPEDVVVDAATLTQTRRDLVTIVGVVALDIAYYV